MPVLESFHNGPLRIGRLLWHKKGVKHFVQPHWMNKSVMRAVIKKGWLRISEPSNVVKGGVKKIDKSRQKVKEKPPIERPVEEPRPVGELLSDVSGGVERPEVEETPSQLQVSPFSSEEEEEWPQPKEKISKELLFKTDLETKSFKELKEIAHRFGVTGRAKSDLIERILEAQSDK